MTPGERSKCDTCGAQVIGAMLSTGGGPWPVDLRPHRAGDILLYKAADGTPTYAALNPALAGQLSALGIPLRRMHRVCPGPDPYAQEAT